MNRLGRGPHDFGDADPPVPYPVKCCDCGFTLPQDTEPLPLCPGPKEERSQMKRTPLEPGRPPRRKTRLNSVSDRRAEKRSSSVTGETLVFGPVCDWVRGEGCFLRFWFNHTCEGRPGRRPIEACHLDRRGKGHGDWAPRDGAAALRVIGGCPKAHDALDEHRAVDGCPHHLIVALAESYAEALTARSPIEPPEHVVMEARGELV